MVYHFPIFGHLQGVLPGLFLLAMFGLKENRNKSSLWIIAVVAVLWSVFVWVKHMFGIPTSSEVELNLMFTGMVGSFAAVLLLGGCLNGFKRMGILFVPVLFLGVIYLSGVITDETLDMTVFLTLSILSVYGAFLGAKVACRWAFSIRVFLLWKGICMAVLLLVILLITAYALSFTHDFPTDQIIPEVLFCTLTCTVIYYIGALPFEILMFVNPFWKKRFEAVFRLKVSETF